MDPNLTPQQAKDLVTGLIDSYRDGMLYNYFTYNDHQWNCDQQSINNLVGINTLGLVNGGSIPAGVQWRDHNNNYVVVDFPYMAGMGNSYFSFLMLVYQANWAHKANVLALNDSVLIQDYDYQSTLWPDPNTQY